MKLECLQEVECEVNVKRGMISSTTRTNFKLEKENKVNTPNKLVRRA